MTGHTCIPFLFCRCHSKFCIKCLYAYDFRMIAEPRFLRRKCSFKECNTPFSSYEDMLTRSTLQEKIVLEFLHKTNFTLFILRNQLQLFEMPQHALGFTESVCTFGYGAMFISTRIRCHADRAKLHKARDIPCYMRDKQQWGERK